MFNLKLKKMKKVTYLVVLMLSLVVLSTSCCKDDTDDPIVPKTITVNDLKGYWNFEKLVIDGTTYNWDVDAIALDADYNVGALDLEFGENNSPNTMRYYDLFVPDPNVGYDDNFTLANDVITFGNGMLVFKIENASTFLTSDNKSVLKLKLSSTNFFTDAPVGGVYTLTK